MRSPTFIAVAAFIALLIAGSVAVWAFDASREDRIAEGVRVGGIMVGGMDREAARAKLGDELLHPLKAPVVVRTADRRFRLTAAQSKVSADVDAMVDEAIERSRKGNVFSRAWREATGGDVDADISPRVTYSVPAVRRLVARVARHIDRPAVDAKVDFSAGDLEKVKEHAGRRLRRSALRGQVRRALTRPADSQRVVTAHAVRVKPKVTTDELADKYETVVTVDRGGFTLRLFKRLKLVRSYPIAVGQQGLETPAGLYHVQNKAVNPAWNVPNSPWAGSLAGTVVPGGTPENPLKARWLGIYNGAGIHGTDATGSIGTNASHGCIRMLIPDVIELYDRVPVGAPVYIA